MWGRQVAVLREAGADPIWIGRRGDQLKLGRGARVLLDELSGIGPIAGLHSALRAVERGWVAVLAVDMPAIEADWFEKLFARCSRGVGAVARHADGFEPLAAIYPCEALEIVSRRVKAKEFSLQGLVKALVRTKRMRVVDLPASERWRVANWNEPMECGGSTPLLGDVARHVASETRKRAVEPARAKAASSRRTPH